MNRILISMRGRVRIEVVTNHTICWIHKLPDSSIQTYTWDARGNLLSDGTFTYTYNAAGRMVWAQSVTTTLVYTYTAGGLRVAQSVDGDMTSFAWDWASGVPEMLTDGDNVYLVGHDTLGAWDGATWAYHLPDALGSVRQVVGGAGSVVSGREWTPFGVEVGAGQAGLGFAGEWWDASVGLTYLRARWYEPQIGIFLSRDFVRHNPPYQYAEANPVNLVDPSGKVPRPPIPRPTDVCPSPGVMTIFWRPDYILRHKDGSRAYYPSWDVDAWWYCGEFKVTAYQFVLESAYVNADGTLMSPSSQGTTDQGTSFSTSGLFARDVEVNGTGRADISQPCIEQDNYISNLERAGSDFTCTCGKGRDFDPDTDAYKVVATDLEYLRMGAQIYAPDLEDESDPRGNADFTVKDTGGRVRRYHIDVFTGEGPGILAGDLGSVPSLQYTAYHHYQRGVPFAGDALGPLAVYQKSQVHWFFYICD